MEPESAWYTIRSTNPAYDLMNLRSIEDWTLYKEFRKVDNVVDVSDFGGTAREYQVRVDPNKLISYGLNISQIENQLAANNAINSRRQLLARRGSAATERPRTRTLSQCAGY